MEDVDGPAAPIDRYYVEIDKRSKQISFPELITLSREDQSEAILSATGHHLAVIISIYRPGALSISYKISVQEIPGVTYLIQLRHHGNVSSMDALMGLISRTIDSKVLPLPVVYPIPGEKCRQNTTGFGRQITTFIPGVMASMRYPHLCHDHKLVFVRKMALAYQACWSIPLQEPHTIGELIATEFGGQREVALTVGPDRHHGLGGPFPSVREYLQAYIKSSVLALVKQQGIDEYKDTFLKRIQDFVNTRMNIPATVEDVPIVAMHADMGPHNIIVSESSDTCIQAVIDWEFVASAPFAALYRVMEMLFRRPAENGFGAEYDRANELRLTFWDTIPFWKSRFMSESTQVFLEWFRFGLLMKAEWRPNGLSKA